MSEKIRVKESTGNIFADLGLPNAEERLAKAMLSRQIQKVIEERGLSQAEAGKLLEVSPLDVSNVLRGDLSDYPLERLTRFLTILGHDVEIRVPGARPKRRCYLYPEDSNAARPRGSDVGACD